ncbi:hypothetical protein [Nocardia arizonensis]|uniref:hypothetical protein n=1 Tax=Nocardia arizonensis TaxID=1141647 RepID=UPI0006D00F80|nr:hypothetical protein [Nocardia arizonensis]
MRSIGAFSAAAAAVLVAGLSGCAYPSDDAAEATTARTPTPTTSAAPPPTRGTTTAPAIPFVVEIPCGAGPFGLEMTTVSRAVDTACAEAAAVLGVYLAQSGAHGGDVVITVAVGAGVWECRAVQGRATPTRECVDKDDPAQTIRLGL